MKKILWLIIITFIIGVGNIQAKNLQAHFSYATFFSLEEGPYIETYLSIKPESAHYTRTESGKFQASVQVTLKFKNGEKIAAYDKYKLNSPKIEDTTNMDVQFIDQKRYSLPKGDYDLHLTLNDVHSDQGPQKVNQPVSVDYKQDSLSFSDVQMVDHYKKAQEKNVLTKSGYDLVPYPSNYFPENKKNLTFYSELYNTDQVLGDDQPFLMKFFVENATTGQMLENYVRTKRMEAKPVHVVFHDFDINNLPTGNYRLKLQVFNKDNEKVTSKVSFFQRTNSKVKLNEDDIADISVNQTFASRYTEKPALIENVKTLKPIATSLEKSFLRGNLQKKSLEILQKFFYTFWVDRDKMNPRKRWEKYLQRVEEADKKFATAIKEGYETDRGRVFLQYGSPNSISRSHNEPQAYPYEIWHYYSTEKRRKSIFIFYSHDMVTNAFELIHSNVPGEVKNRKWQLTVLGRGDQDPNVDVEEYPDIWGSEKGDWNIPY